MGYQLRTGIVPGRSHILDARNCQDALCSMSFEYNGQPYIVGVIADGCGEGKHSEVGAELAVQFIAYEVRRLVQDGKVDIPQTLFERLIHFLKGIVGAYNFSDVREFVKFVNNHLLFTVIGFIVSPEQTLVFAAGDGIVVLNDEVHLREQNNAPAYIGYQLIDRRYLQANTSPLPTTFDMYSLPTKSLKRLAIGSDAWISEQPLLDQVWDTKMAAGLQLQMNKWSDARHFKDDASMVLLEFEPGIG